MFSLAKGISGDLWQEAERALRWSGCLVSGQAGSAPRGDNLGGTTKPALFQNAFPRLAISLTQQLPLPLPPAIALLWTVKLPPWVSPLVTSSRPHGAKSWRKGARRDQTLHSCLLRFPSLLSLLFRLPQEGFMIVIFKTKFIDLESCIRLGDLERKRKNPGSDCFFSLSLAWIDTFLHVTWSALLGFLSPSLTPGSRYFHASGWE